MGRLNPGRIFRLGAFAEVPGLGFLKNDSLGKDITKKYCTRFGKGLHINHHCSSIRNNKVLLSFIGSNEDVFCSMSL